MITFLAGTGAIVLTFLAGAELDPEVFRARWKESSAANARFMPRHLLPGKEPELGDSVYGEPVGDLDT